MTDHPRLVCSKHAYSSSCCFSESGLMYTEHPEGPTKVREGDIWSMLVVAELKQAYYMAEASSMFITAFQNRSPDCHCASWSVKL